MEVFIYSCSCFLKNHCIIFHCFVVVHLLSCVRLPSHGLQHARLPCPSQSPWVCLNSCPLSWWCHPVTSSSIVPFSSCLQSFLVSASFLMSRLFESGGQSIGASTSASVLPINIQGWFPLGWTGWISLQSKGLSRVFSNITVWKHQFLRAQPSLWSNSHIHIWLLEKPLFGSIQFINPSPVGFFFLEWLFFSSAVFL